MLLAERRKKQAVAGKIGHDEYQYKLNGDPANYPDHQPVREPRVGNLYNNNNVGPPRQQQGGGVQPPYAVDNNNNNGGRGQPQQQAQQPQNMMMAMMMPTPGGNAGLFGDSPPFAAAELFSRPQAAAPPRLLAAPATPLPPMGPVAELPPLLPPVYRPKPPLYFHGASASPPPAPAMLALHRSPLADAFTSPQVEQVVVLPALGGPQRPNTTPSAVPAQYGAPSRVSHSPSPVSSRQGGRAPSSAAGAAFRSDIFAPDGRSEQDLQRERKLAERRRAQEIQAENARQMAEHQRRRQEARAREIAEARAAEERLRRERDAEAAKLAPATPPSAAPSAPSPASEAEVVPVLVRVPRRNSAAGLAQPVAPSPAPPTVAVSASSEPSSQTTVSAPSVTTSSFALSPMPPVVTGGPLLAGPPPPLHRAAPEMTVIQLSTPNPPTTLHPTGAQLWPPPPSSFLNDQATLQVSQRPLWSTPPRSARPASRTPPPPQPQPRTQSPPRPAGMDSYEKAHLQHEIDALAAEQRRLSALLLHPRSPPARKNSRNNTSTTDGNVGEGGSEEGVLGRDAVSPLRTPRSASGAGTYLTTGQPAPRVGGGVGGGDDDESSVPPPPLTSAHVSPFPPSLPPLSSGATLSSNLTPPSPRLANMFGEPQAMNTKAPLFTLSPLRTGHTTHDTLGSGPMRETAPFASHRGPPAARSNATMMDNTGVDLAVSSRIVGGSPRPTVTMMMTPIDEVNAQQGEEGKAALPLSSRQRSPPRTTAATAMTMGVFGDPELTAEPSKFIGIA